MDILDELNESDVNKFTKDFKELLRVSFGIDREYSISAKKVDEYMQDYEKAVKLFNKKYKGIKLKIEKKIDRLQLRIFLKEKHVKDVFTQAASKIAGLKSAGAESFNKADISKTDEFSREIERAKDKLFLTYYESLFGSMNIFIEHNKKEKMIELNYDSDILNEASPELKLCTYYGLKDSYNRKIDIQSITTKMGFIDLLSDKEKKEWLDKFNPRLEE